MALPHDYAERVYAGVLGKLIGVYLGRPFEGWLYEKILKELGEIDYYVNERLPWNPPLVVTDDDITGTFTFLRALPDYGSTLALTPAQIGQTWLNYIIENRTILWWGGFGNSTEHTAYLRLKSGIPAPRSGSSALNGRLIAEQIGAQIFIDGWALVAPGDPALAADLARRAARVSHDGEAVYAAQVLAAMEAQAFVEPDIHRLLDVGVSFIPRDSTIYRMIADIRELYAAEPEWHAGRGRLARVYNYQNYGGNCHVVPNHGLIIFALLYGGGDFTQSMRIVNTSGWDTDCNAGNLGCLLGIKDGLQAFEKEKDWRGPVADRLYLPTADGGRAITDAVQETVRIVNLGRALHKLDPLHPKQGARFTFAFPGSVQGFRPCEGGTTLENISGEAGFGGRALAVHFKAQGSAATPTFILPNELDMAGYNLLASPTLYAGQTLRARLQSPQTVRGRLFVRVYDQADALQTVYGPEFALVPWKPQEPHWQLPGTHGQPVAQVGLAFQDGPGTVYLDYLTWEGAPEITLTRPFGAAQPGSVPQVWRRAWVNALDEWGGNWPEPYRLVQNHGRGLLIQGAREWVDYVVEADITPWLMDGGGIAARVQGLRRFYALQLVGDNQVRLLKALDGDVFLGEAEFPWETGQTYHLKLQVQGNTIQGWVNERQLFAVEDDQPLVGGGVAYVIDQGHLASQAMSVRPAA